MGDGAADAQDSSVNHPNSFSAAAQTNDASRLQRSHQGQPLPLGRVESHCSRSPAIAAATASAAATAAAGPLAIGISLVAAGLAAANLLIDMNWILRASYSRMPRWMEWYSAQSLMVTLVWFYTEVLRLLWMLAGGRRDE